MVDVNRDEVTRLVYRKLADPGFSSRLTATAPDGTHPVVVALREDSMRSLIDDLAAVGGAANVVVPMLNGVVVVAVTSGDRRRRGRAERPPTLLRDDCTVGLFLEQLRLDLTSGGDDTYGFVVEGERRKERGRASLVALAG